MKKKNLIRFMASALCATLLLTCFACKKDSGSSNPAYYTTGEGLRIYGKNTFVISSDNAFITPYSLCTNCSNTIFKASS